jgi:2,3-bisphosphoglycerate-dependent phosphoglycerate mutase
MEPTRIIAVRHGETAWNVATRIQGHLDIALNERGHWQAEQAAQALASEELAAIYSSDLLRAWTTALSIADACGLPVTTDEHLRERHFGHFEGKTFDEVAALWPHDAQRWRTRDPVFAPPQGGESLVEVQTRIVAAASRIAARHTGQHVLLVTHGGALDALYRSATGQSLQAPRTWQLGNAAINRLLWTPDGFTLVGWADVRHLSEQSIDEASA